MTVLVVRNLTRHVQGRALFDGLSLELAPGDRVAVRGPSGSGKTALLRALACLDPLTSGAFTLDGKSPEAWGIPGWRSEVTWVAQRPPALGETPQEAAEQIAALQVQREREVDDPVALAKGWALPPDRWTQSWSTLSGGEQQRAWLAICLARRPRILLLDEPTSALDGDARAAVERELKDRTFLWVTHDDEQAERVAERTLLLGSPAASPTDARS